jgi:hypothetical protein
MFKAALGDYVIDVWVGCAEVRCRRKKKAIDKS